MAPERDYMSAYLDGEIPPRWRERFRRKIEQDAQCRMTLEQHTEVHEALQSLPEPEFAESRDRIWAAVRERIADQDGVDIASPAAMREIAERTARYSFARTLPFWRRHVRMPLPLAAAAAVVIASVSALVPLGIQYAHNRSSDAQMAQTVEGLKVTVNVQDVDQLLDILNGRNKIKEVQIDLPQPHQFKLMGEPLLLKASDNLGGVR